MPLKTKKIMNNTRTMTTEESFAQLEAVRNEKNPYALTREEWRTFSEEQKNARYKQERQWKEDHDARELQAIRNIVPEIGLPCTVVYWSDYRAATVTRIITPRKIAVRHNATECKDYYAGNYDILPKLEGGEDIFTKRRNGRWVMEGHETKDGVRLALHYQRHYIDPSF